MSETRVTIRMPAALRNRLADDAHANSISLNSLVVQRLSAPFSAGIGPTPPGWAADRLSWLIDLGVRNTFATFHNEKDLFQRLSAIWDAYDTFTADSVNPSDLAADGILGEPATFAALFFNRAQSALLAGANLATATQAGDVYPPLRTSLEWAVYAYDFAHDPTKLSAWISRSDGVDERGRAKSSSQIKPMLRNLGTEHPEIGSIAMWLYDHLIDYGAHPNDQALFGNMTLHEDEAGKRYNTLIYTDDELSTRVAVKTAARVGLAELFIANLIFPRRFAQLGLDRSIRELSDGL